MGLCGSTKATATASVSPTRATKNNSNVSTETTLQSSSNSISAVGGSSDSTVNKNYSGRAIALRKVGENSFMSNLVETHSGSITEEYTIDAGKPLGTGMSCVVKRITHRLTGKKYALKAVRLNRMKPDKIVDLRREIEIMKALDHPNIIKLYQTFEDHSYIYMVMELCTGGELFDRLADQRDAKFTESKAADLVSKMLSSLNYIHLRRVCHRDLKLENFIFENSDKEAEIKLIDFGLSKVYLEDSAHMKAVLGTSYYVAPEVLAGDYGMECDLWGLGVLTFMLLSGQAPFSGEEDSDILKLVKIGKFSFTPRNIWRNISKSAQDFISKLLVVDPKARMTAQEALQHPWMTEHRDQKIQAMNQNEDEMAEGKHFSFFFSFLNLFKMLIFLFSLALYNRNLRYITIIP
jgi:calcium-dependent protein kinase